MSLRGALVLPSLAVVLTVLAPSASPAFAATGNCSSSQLRLSSVRILGATGHRIWDLALTKRAGGVCTLRGYPTVVLLNRRGQATVSSRRAAGFPVRTVALSQARRAFFTINYAAAGPCLPHYFTAYGIVVFPPGSSRGLRLMRAPFTVCSVALGGHPHVTPVRGRLNES